MANPADATGTKTFHEDEGAVLACGAGAGVFAAFFYKLREKSAAAES